MEMENINENTIRVSIEGSDLAERGITFLDLLGDQKQIESFFYSVLEEVDVSNRFHESDAITFQVLPKGSGLELFISKGDDEFFDNLDTDEEDLKIVNSIIAEMEDAIPIKPSRNFQEDVGVLEVFYRFEEFEDFVETAHRFHLENGLSSLYHYEGAYYLLIEFFVESDNDERVETEMSIAMEFGEEVFVARDVVEEHGQILMANEALQTARTYF